MRVLTLILGVIFAAIATVSWAAPPERRVALVIGNSAYQKFPRLPNPRNDAEDVTASLKRIGFTVVGGTDLTRDEMRQRLSTFARMAQDADAALVYYAGHGLQYRGRNFLVPVDAKLEDEFDISSQTVRVDDLVEELMRAEGARILILDACRNLPIANARGKEAFSGTGLAKLSGRGLIVAYATQANAIAYDGKGRNSIFTEAFVKAVDEPGLEAASLFQKVSINVDRQTSGRQTPEVSLSYPGQFYFNRSETDLDVWKRVGESRDPDALREFIARFPDSFLVVTAKYLIERIEEDRKREGRTVVARAPTERETPDRPRRDEEPRRAPDVARGGPPAPDTQTPEERERQAWQRLDEEQARRTEARQRAERERIAGLNASEQERRLREMEQRSAAAERERVAREERASAAERERSAAAERAAGLERERLAAAEREQAAAAEQERLAAAERQREEARQRKLAEDKAEQERRQKLAEERAAAERERAAAAERTAAAERERLAVAERQREEARQRRLAEDKAEQERRQKLAEERAAAERERLAAAERQREEARQRKLAEDQAEQERRQKLAEERAAVAERERAAAAERVAAAERERVALAERQQEDARQRKLAEERAEQTRQQKVAEERANADRSAAAERERVAVAERQREEARQRKVAEDQAEQERQQKLAEEARQRKVVEEQEAAERRRVAQAEETARVEREREAWARLEADQQRRRAAAGQPTEPVPPPTASTFVDGQPSQAPSATESGEPVARRYANAEPTVIAPTPDRSPAPSVLPNTANEPLDARALTEATLGELSRIGCASGETIEAALRRYARRAKLAVPGTPTASLLRELRERPEGFCPVECGAGQRVQGGVCVAIPRRSPAPAAPPVAVERRQPRAPAVAEPRQQRPAPRPAVAEPRSRPPAPRAVAASQPRPAAAPARAPAAAGPRPAAINGLGMGF